MGNTADTIGAIILGILATWFLFRMNMSETIIDVLKWGFTFVATVIQMVGVTSRANRRYMK